MLDDETLARILASRGPARPAPDLVARIMDRMDGIPANPATESVVEQWIRIVWPLALVSAAAAVVLGVGGLREGPTEVVEPISQITNVDADLDQVLAIPR